MNKVINNVEVEINVDFWEKYILGEIELEKSSSLDCIMNPKINKIIESYKKVYNKIYWMFQKVQCKEKYMLIAKKMGIKNYIINEDKLIIQEGELYIAFSNNRYFLLSGDEVTDIYIIENEFLTNLYDDVYKYNSIAVVEKYFNDFYNACQCDETIMQREAECILTKANVIKKDLINNIVFDANKKIYYRIFPYVDATKKSSGYIVDIGNKLPTIKDIKNINYDTMTQSFVEAAPKLFVPGKIQPLKFKADISALVDLLKMKNITNCKGLILQDKLYCEIENDIFTLDETNKPLLMVKNGKIYGYTRNNHLLINSLININQDVIKETIYIINDNYMDIYMIFLHKRGL